MLRRRGIRYDVVEDVVQETAARVIVHRVAFTDADDLYRWASVVAYRVAIDTIRRERHQTELVREEPSTTDVPREAISRQWLHAVELGFAQLPEAEREAIFPHIQPTDRRTAVRSAVRRHRARAHLVQLAEGLAVALGWLADRMVRGRARRMATAAALSPVLVMFATTLIPNIGTPSTHAPGITSAAGDGTHLEIAPRPYVAPMPAPAARVLADTAVAPARLPSIRIPVQTPVGGAVIDTGPKQPGDHFLCIDTDYFGRHCIDLPINMTN